MWSRIHKILIVAALILLGGCSAANPGDYDRYTYVSAYLSGQITATDGQPIPKIRIHIVGYDQYYVESYDDGKFILSQENVLLRISERPYYISLMFTDVDGDANGGRFIDKVHQAEFSLMPDNVVVISGINVTMDRLEK